MYIVSSRSNLVPLVSYWEKFRVDCEKDHQYPKKEDGNKEGREGGREGGWGRGRREWDRKQ